MFYVVLLTKFQKSAPARGTKKCEQKFFLFKLKKKLRFQNFLTFYRKFMDFWGQFLISGPFCHWLFAILWQDLIVWNVFTDVYANLAILQSTNSFEPCYGQKRKANSQMPLTLFLTINWPPSMNGWTQKTFAQLLAHIKLHKSMAESAINSETSYYIKYVKMKGTPIINS